MNVQLSAALALVMLALEWISPGRGPSGAAPVTAAEPSVTATAAAVSVTAPTLEGAARTRVIETLARQPLRFEANAGQFAADVRYAARGLGYGVALTQTGATLTLADAGRAADVVMSLVDLKRTAGSRARRCRRGPAAWRRQPLHRRRSAPLAGRRPSVRPRASHRCLRGHRPGVLRQPGGAGVRLPRRTSRRSFGDPPPVRRRRPARDRSGRRSAGPR